MLRNSIAAAFLILCWTIPSTSRGQQSAPPIAAPPITAAPIAGDLERERIAATAEDLELLEEFVGLEPTTAVAWKAPMQSAPDANQGPWLLTLKLDGECRVVGVWPIFSEAPNTFVLSLTKPRTEVKTVTTQLTTCRPETRTRMVCVTKSTIEHRTRYRQVEETLPDETKVTKQVPETYSVEVPVTEMLEQAYTVMVPVIETRDISVQFVVPFLEDCTEERVIPSLGGVQGQWLLEKLPLFRGDRRPATWQQFTGDCDQNAIRQAILFPSIQAWDSGFDSMIDPDAFVIVADPLQVNPIDSAGATILKDVRGWIDPLPTTATRSQLAEHLFPFSPFVSVKTRRPMDLPARPIAVAPNLDEQLQNNREELLAVAPRSFRVDLDPNSWSTIRRMPLSSLAIENQLSSGRRVLLQDRDSNWLSWANVLRADVGVYLGAVDQPEAVDNRDPASMPGGAIANAEQNTPDQINSLFQVRRALDRHDFLSAAQFAREIWSTDLIDATTLNQIAFQLHASGDEIQAAEFAGAALRLDSEAFDRTRLIRFQGHSRDWLESTRLRLTGRWKNMERENTERIARMQAIQKALGEPRRDRSPVASVEPSSDTAPQPAFATPQPEPAPEPGPAPVVAPAPAQN